MSTNCIKCVKNRRTGPDLLCDECRPAAASGDSIIESLRERLRQRSWRGINKYGVTLDRTDLSLADWLAHARDEALDFAAYCERAIRDLPKRTEILSDTREPDGFSESPGRDGSFLKEGRGA